MGRILHGHATQWKDTLLCRRYIQARRLASFFFLLFKSLSYLNFRWKTFCFPRTSVHFPCPALSWLIIHTPTVAHFRSDHTLTQELLSPPLARTRRHSPPHRSSPLKLCAWRVNNIYFIFLTWSTYCRWFRNVALAINRHSLYPHRILLSNAPVNIFFPPPQFQRCKFPFRNRPHFGKLRVD